MQGFQSLYWENEYSQIDGSEDYFQSHLQCHICKQKRSKEMLPRKSDDLYVYVCICIYMYLF